GVIRDSSPTPTRWHRILSPWSELPRTVTFAMSNRQRQLYPARTLMARVDPKLGLMPSVLDRLVDPASAGTEGQRGYTLNQMMEAVRKDLEELLNTRQTLDAAARRREKV